MSFKCFDFSTLSPRDIYRLVIEAVVPRPIAFVSTEGLDGSRNLAPFSFFNAVSSQPPAVMFACTPRRDGKPKDSLRNILETGEFVINSTHESFASKMNQTGADYPYGINEMEKVGLHPLPSVKVRPPRVAEALVQLECKLLQTVAIGSGLGSSTLVIGEILALHVNETALTGDSIAIEKYEPLARLGGLLYSRTLGRESFEIDRPSPP